MSDEASWTGNFCDLAASVTRLATFAPKGRIDLDTVEQEIARLKRLWAAPARSGDGLETMLRADRLAALDAFDRVQLGHVVAICHESRSLSEAGHRLFAASLARLASANDADRLRKYLARFELDWQAVQRQAPRSGPATWPLSTSSQHSAICTIIR